jgi:hypothetical protein
LSGCQPIHFGQQKKNLKITGDRIMQEQYNFEDIFFCKHDKTYQRKSGCAYRMGIQIDDCSALCKQAEQEKIVPLTNIIKRRK